MYIQRFAFHIFNKENVIMQYNYHVKIHFWLDKINNAEQNTAQIWKLYCYHNENVLIIYVIVSLT